MSRGYKPEQIISMRREAEVTSSQDLHLDYAIV
jgi:hypothetical protein